MELADETEKFAVLGLTGAGTAAVMARLTEQSTLELGYFRHRRCCLAGIEADLARLSYVGEAGWEITCRAADADALYRALIEAEVEPAGLFATTSMRIEKRFLAFGHDLDADMDPLQAGLEFSLDWDSDFIGKAALLDRRGQTPRQRIVSILFASAEAQPLGNEPVYHAGRIIGKTTSAAFGYRVGKPVAIALIAPPEGSDLDGLAVDVDIARSQNAGTILLTSAYDPEGSCMRNTAGKS